jgi:hypothetical protein
LTHVKLGRFALLFVEADGITESVQVIWAMPSLIRFLVVIGLIVGAVYGGMVALVMFVEPNPREMTVRIPSERLQP